MTNFYNPELERAIREQQQHLHELQMRMVQEEYNRHSHSASEYFDFKYVWKELKAIKKEREDSKHHLTEKDFEL